MKKLFLLVIIFFLPVFAFAETTGVINFNNISASVTTGLTGYTVNLCNSTDACFGLKCFLDYDNISTAPSFGWCNSTVISSCYHNNSEYGTGTNICDTNTTYRTCSSGNWSAVPLNCSSGQTCPSAFGTPGNCSTSSSSSSSSGGSSSTTNATQKTASIVFISIPLDFDMVQGTSALRHVTVKNNGNLTLYNITLSSSLTWAYVLPQKYNQSVKNNETTFQINFSAPEDAAVKTHIVTLQITTSNASVNPSATFRLSIQPSNKTVQEQIFPEYYRYEIILAELEANMTQLEAKGADVNELKALLLEAKSKLLQVNRSLESKEYASAAELLADVNNALSAAANKINAITAPAAVAAASQNTTLFIAIVLVAAVIMFILYLLWPSKPAKPYAEKGWLAPQTETRTRPEKKGFFQKLRGNKKKK